jgi:4'-phosphopantetheinyl transferase
LDQGNQSVVGRGALVKAQRARLPVGQSTARCEVHLARLHGLRAAHLSLLDVSELARAHRYWLRADRDRVLLGAVLLRTAAGRRLGVAPADVEVDRTCDRCGAQHGRPRLPGAGLHASVSHSGDVVAVALTAAGPVGVDVEAVRAIDLDAITDTVCGPAERRQLRTPADFYSFWTRKEAVLKATGDGLRRPMTDVHVTPPDSVPKLLRLGSTRPACQLADLAVRDGYRAAVAVLGPSPLPVSIVDAAAELLSCGSRERRQTWDDAAKSRAVPVRR